MHIGPLAVWLSSAPRLYYPFAFCTVGDDRRCPEKEQVLFYRFAEVTPDDLVPGQFERVTEISKGLPRAEIVEIIRHNVTVRIHETDEFVSGDVTQSGFTVYLGGFDWVTFPTPQHLLQKFPEFLPLPQQVFRSPLSEMGEEDFEDDLIAAAGEDPLA